MFPGEILLGLVLMALQVLLFLLCVDQRIGRFIRSARSLQVMALVGTEVLLVSAFVLWSHDEVGDNLLRAIRGSAKAHTDSSVEHFAATGDPALSQLVLEQRPELLRPDFNGSGDLRTWQSALRRTLLLEVFALQEIASPVDVPYKEESSTTVGGNITRTFLTFESFDGTLIPAYLFTPSVQGPAPAILVLHGHVRPDHQEGISQTGGVVDSYQHRTALELAKAGFVTLTIEFRGFGYLGARAGGDHEVVAYNALLGGSFYKAVLCKDIRYALSVLRTVKNVDSQRIGITGVSYGGEMAATYAALDERIKVVVFQGFGGSLGPLPGRSGRDGSPAPYYYHLIPGHNRYMRQEDVFLLIAPRPLLGVRGSRDFSGDSTFSSFIGKAYESFQASSNFQFELVPDGGHEYFVEPAIRFFKQHL